MRNKIELWIGDQRADLDNQSFILLNYTMEELSNPTIVKNSFSKQITLKGTAQNNLIFGGIYRNDRSTVVSSAETGPMFDPTRKTSFQIIAETGELLEEGYLKLDKVTMTKKRVEYTVTLYGGLGSFLYGLSYKANGEKMTLADLTFSESLDFTINRSTVEAAWQSLDDGDNSGQWTLINFMPSYNGLPPSPFDANKCIVKAGTVGLQESNGDYATKDGWSLVTLADKVTGNEAKDFRSYLQKPVIRFKSVIQAICDPANNGGYTVNLDSEFTDSDNPHWPYWNDSWLTLPMLNDLNIDGSVTQGDTNFNGGTFTIPGGGNLSTLYNIWVDFAMVGSGSANNDDLVLHCEDDWAAGSAVNDNPGMYLNYIEWEVIAYDSNDAVITQFYYRVSTQQAPEGMTQMDDVIDYISLGYHFTKNGSVWKPNITIQEYGVAKVKITQSFKSMSWGNLRASGDPTLAWPVNTYDYSLGESFSAYAELSGSYINYQLITSSTVRTGASITKANLLGQSKTPADYLLSFCKMFGMQIVCHKGEKVVDILMRKNFYSSLSAKDISARIDRGKPMGKVPFAFDARWYLFGNDPKGEFSEYYANKYSRPYGQYRVNTGYEFDAAEKKMTDSIVFGGACDVLETSKYFCDLSDNGVNVPSVFLGGGKQTLYKGGETKDFDIAYPLSAVKTWFNASYPMHDDYAKVQLHGSQNAHLDERDTLVFFNGMMTPASGHLTLSDDIRAMLSLNGNNPCWMPNYCDYDSDWLLAKLPRFSRYKWTSATVNTSFDWGTPSEAQIPGVTFATGSNIFDQYWSKYITDRYDDDSAVVTCYVDWRGYQIGPDLFKNFYFFDNCVWALNRIINYSLTTFGTVQCEFVKVQATTNYTSL